MKLNLGHYIGFTIGMILAFVGYSVVSVLCGFGSCKITAWLIPLAFVVFGFLIGGWLGKLFRKS